MGRKGKGKRYQDEAATAVVEDVKDEAGDDSSSDDDDSSQSSASSTSSSEDSPTPSDLNSNKGHHDASSKATPSKSKTWDSMDGYQVRQNAIKLLNSPETNANESNGGVDRKMNSITYKSYHDSPYSNGSHFSSSETSTYNTSAQPNWGDSRYNANDAGDDSLSVYHVASLTFNCIAHCLTEGYRAASTYYNSSYPEDSAPSHMGGYQPTSSSYGHVGSYQDSYGGSGGQSQEREVMERETSQLKAPGGSGNEDGDWGTTVKLPSTYQGKK